MDYVCDEIQPPMYVFQTLKAHLHLALPNNQKSFLKIGKSLLAVTEAPSLSWCTYSHDQK